MRNNGTELVCALVACVLMVVPGSVFAADCTLQWSIDGQGGPESEPTTETSRTEAAALQLFQKFQTTCFGPPDFDGNCYDSSIEGMGYGCGARVCLDGFWDTYYWCDTSPPCADATFYMSGSWDVVCEPQSLIELSAFDAMPLSGAVVLEWITDAEIDNAGFNLYRSDRKDGEYEQINTALIPAEGSPTAGAAYEYTDGNVKNLRTYWYMLEDIDNNGVGTLHEPVSATPRFVFGLLP